MLPASCVTHHHLQAPWLNVSTVVRQDVWIWRGSTYALMRHSLICRQSLMSSSTYKSLGSLVGITWDNKQDEHVLWTGSSVSVVPYKNHNHTFHWTWQQSELVSLEKVSVTQFPRFRVPGLGSGGGRVFLADNLPTISENKEGRLTHEIK